jgi:hypothetical protein
VSGKTKCAICAAGNYCLSMFVVSRCFCRFRVTVNVLQLPEGGDFGALHCQPSRNFDRSTKLDLTTEPPLLGRCCYAFALLFRMLFVRSYCRFLSCVGLVALLQNLALAWACAVLQMCHQKCGLFHY